MRNDQCGPDLPGSLWTLVLVRTLLVSESPLGPIFPVNGSVDVDVDGLPRFRSVTELTFAPDSSEAPFVIRRGLFLRTRAKTKSTRMATCMVMHNSEICMPNYYGLQTGFTLTNLKKETFVQTCLPC